MPFKSEALERAGIHFSVVGECWECTSHRPNNNGYPMRHGITLNRFVYRELIGGIGDNYVLHSCDNRMCINPDHLWLGTHADNQADKVAKGRQSRLPGDKNGRAKLAAFQITAIRNDRRKLKEIASEYGVSFGLISRIKRREAWKCRTSL